MWIQGEKNSKLLVRQRYYQVKRKTVSLTEVLAVVQLTACIHDEQGMKKRECDPSVKCF